VGGVGGRQRRSILRMRQIVVSYALKKSTSQCRALSTAHVGTAENSSTLEFSSFARSNDQNLWIALRPGDVKERTFPRKIVLSQNSDQDRRWCAGSGRCADAQGSPGRGGVQREHGQFVAAG
jgi:hypothetical protein